MPLSRAAFTKKRLALAGGVLLLGGLGLGLGLGLSQGSPPSPVALSTTTTAPPATTTTAPPPPPKPTNRCPLTDLPARGGVPKRAAVAVKVGNEPFGARPQSGLNEADIVFDTPAEGFIMRYIAVYQCENAASIGPTRSVRWVDWHLVRQFINPILAFAGGINPNVDTVEGFHWLRAADLLTNAGNAGTRIGSRVPPDNLYTSTAALYRLFPRANKAPQPVFDYSARLPRGGQRANSLYIDFSYDTDVVWRWDPSARGWLHTYSGVPDVDALTGKPVTTNNIVVLLVNYQFGPYAESTGGSGDFESMTLGRGVGYVLRNGVSIKVTWHRPYLISPFTFTRGGGETVTLTPGRTWVELVPVGQQMGFSR